MATVTSALCTSLLFRAPTVVTAVRASRASVRTLAPFKRRIVTSVPKGLSLSSDFVPATSIKLSKQFVRRASNGATGGAMSATATATVEDIKGAKSAIEELIKSKNCNPILIRLGWHDSGTYDKNKAEFPARGGANGSIRFMPEKGHGSNAGLDIAMTFLDDIKEKYPSISYADLFQLASATAVELAGGPKIDLKFGRVDAPDCDACPAEGNLPDAGATPPQDHLRKIFYRMGFNDQEIVALSGAHTLGRSRKERSGWGKESTKYTEKGPGSPGGQSWTVEWLKFDNSYFKDIKEKTDAELLVLPTDAVLFEDEGFKPFAEKYLNDEKAFFDDYAKAHKKLSELGAKFDPPEGVSLSTAPAENAGPVPEKFSAAKYSSGEKDLSPEMKAKLRAEYLAIGGSPESALQSNYFLNIIIGISILAILTKLAGGF